MLRHCEMRGAAAVRASVHDCCAILEQFRQEPTGALLCSRRTKAGRQRPDCIKEKSMSLAKTHLHPKRDMHDIGGIDIPDSKLAREITELVRDTEPPLLFHHSSRVYSWGALAGKRRGLRFDPELLYAGAMFHDMGLTPAHASAHERFEVDGANTARDFLRSHSIAEQDIATVWTAIALHTT